MKSSRALLVTALLLALTGCERDGIYETTPSIGNIQTLENGIAISRTDQNKIYYFDADMDDPKLSEIFSPKTGESIVWTKPGPEAEVPTELFVLTAPSNLRDTSTDERLYRVTTDGKDPTVYNLGSQFDEIVFSPDERFAILYHGDQDTSSGLYNPNEAALVNLDEKPSSTNPLILSLSMNGKKIDMVSFVSDLLVGGVERQLAVFFAGSIVRVVDLDDPEGTWAKVPLLSTDDTSNFVAAELIAVDEEKGCDNTVCEAKLFIRSLSTQDIYYITLGRSADGFEDVQTKQFEAGGYPSAAAIVNDGDTKLLVVLSASYWNSKINIIDIDTSSAFSLTVSDTLSQMTLLTDAEDNQKLAMWGSASSSVHFLTIPDLLQEKGRNLTSFVVENGISYARVLDDNRLLIIPNSQDLVLLDLSTEDAAMLSSSGDYDWTGAQINEDTFYVLPDSSDRVDYYDLATGQPNSLLLDDVSISLHLLVGQDTGLIWHSTSTGRITLFPLSSPARANALVADGLWLSGSLDEKGGN